MEEIWKDVKGYEGYYKVSNLGRIISLRFGFKIMNPSLNKAGYYTTIFRKNKKSNSVYVHSIVAETFLIKPKSEFRVVVDHINGIRNDNSIENLQWVSDRQNLCKKNGIKKGKQVGVNKVRGYYRCQLSIRSKIIFIGCHKNDLIWLSKLYNKAVELSNLYNGDNAEFRRIVKSSI